MQGNWHTLILSYKSCYYNIKSKRKIINRKDLTDKKKLLPFTNKKNTGARIVKKCF